jgi:hypothetical protein
MNVSSLRLSRLAVVAVAATCCTVLAAAQSSAGKASEAPKRHYAVLAPRLYPDGLAPLAASTSSALETWNGSFVDSGTTYTFNMVGTAPSTNTTATIPVFIIPIKIIVTKSRVSHTFDPAQVLSNGKSVTENTVVSPLFTSSIDYTLGSIDVGTTQYVDAFQRANFWGTVKNNLNSHLLLGNPTVLPERTLNVPSNFGTTGTPFGFTAGLVDINYFDGQVPTILAAEGIQPNAFPIFLTYDVYLTQNRSCCIGGYHSSEGNASNPQSYAQASYVDHPGEFAQDVSALSHEIGEWADDPLTVNPNGNQTPCGILEVGDPLENEANFGDFPYALGGFTYHLQDLAMLPYFGAPNGTTANNWFSFHNASLSVCSNGS